MNVLAGRGRLSALTASLFRWSAGCCRHPFIHLAVVNDGEDCVLIGRDAVLRLSHVGKPLLRNPFRQPVNAVHIDHSSESVVNHLRLVSKMSTNT